MCVMILEPSTHGSRDVLKFRDLEISSEDQPLFVFNNNDSDVLDSGTFS